MSTNVLKLFVSSLVVIMLTNPVASIAAMVSPSPIAPLSTNELSSLEYQLKELSVNVSSSPDGDSETIEQSCTVTTRGMELLNELLEDFKHYTIPPHEVTLLDWRKVTFIPAETLYHHVMWTAHTLENWFSENNFWVKDIDPKDKNLTILAGLLHGIWLGGLQRVKEPEHAFYYLLDQPDAKKSVSQYKTKDSNIFSSFKKLQDSFKISTTDWSIIAITAALSPLFQKIFQHQRGSILDALIGFKRNYNAKFHHERDEHPVTGKRFAHIYTAVAAAHALATREVVLNAPDGDFKFSTIKSSQTQRPPFDSLYTLLKYDDQRESNREIVIRWLTKE